MITYILNLFANILNINKSKSIKINAHPKIIIRPRFFIIFVFVKPIELKPEETFEFDS